MPTAVETKREIKSDQENMLLTSYPFCSRSMVRTVARVYIPTGPHNVRPPYNIQLFPAFSATCPAVTQGKKYVIKQTLTLSKQPKSPCWKSDILMIWFLCGVYNAQYCFDALGPSRCGTNIDRTANTVPFACYVQSGVNGPVPLTPLLMLRQFSLATKIILYINWENSP